MSILNLTNNHIRPTALSENLLTKKTHFLETNISFVPIAKCETRVMNRCLDVASTIQSALDTVSRGGTTLDCRPFPPLNFRKQFTRLLGCSRSDVNECLVNNGHGPCQGACINLEGSYECNCSDIPGHKLAADNHTCEDIDECSTNNGGCSHVCLNTPGSAFCLCPDGFYLTNDWKTCQGNLNNSLVYSKVFQIVVRSL